jgi:hypothetical protein
MTRKHGIASIAAIVSVAALAAPVRAELVAGWDFSQYFTDGLLSLDGQTLTNTLAANYSDFDPTFGAGAESAQYGRMFLDGQFGSTATPLDLENDPIVPSAAAGGSLVSNLNAPQNEMPESDVPFDSCTVLKVEGQLYCNLLTTTALSIQASSSVVFQADAQSESSETWSLAFAGKTFEGTSQLSIDFSSDGANYADVTSIQLTTLDTLYTLGLGDTTGDVGYVRFTFNPVGNAIPFIDNVTISVPEPAGAGGIAAIALIGLSRLRARRGGLAA